MRPLVARADVPAVPPATPSPAQTLVQAVAKAIASAEPHRRYGGYDYTSYAGDAPPHVIRDERDGRVVFRTRVYADYEAEYKRLTEEWVAVKALEAIHAWREQHEPGRPQKEN